MKFFLLIGGIITLVGFAPVNSRTLRGIGDAVEIAVKNATKDAKVSDVPVDGKEVLNGTATARVANLSHGPLIENFVNSTSLSSEENQNVDAYVIEEKTATKMIKWRQTLGGSFKSVIFQEPQYLSLKGLMGMYWNGSINKNYHSHYTPKADFSNPKFSHEVGCTMAHRKIWQQILDRFHAKKSGPWAAVFEGDGLTRSDFNDVIARLETHLPFLTADVVYLGHCFEECKPSQNALNVGDGIKLVPSNKPLCTHAYLLSEKGAAALLKLTMPLTQALDERMKAAIENGELYALSICPTMVRQANKKHKWGHGWGQSE